MLTKDIKRENWPNEPVLRFCKKINYMPCVVWTEESKLVSDLKSDLVMTTSQQCPNVQLKGNPAVVLCPQLWRLATLSSQSLVLVLFSLSKILKYVHIVALERVHLVHFNMNDWFSRSTFAKQTSLKSQVNQRRSHGIPRMIDREYQTAGLVKSKPYVHKKIKIRPT